MALVGLFGFDSRPHTTHDVCVYGKEIMYEIINELRENAVALAEHKKREDALRERIAVLLAKPKLSVPPQARK